MQMLLCVTRMYVYLVGVKTAFLYISHTIRTYTSTIDKNSTHNHSYPQ